MPKLFCPNKDCEDYRKVNDPKANERKVSDHKVSYHKISARNLTKHGKYQHDRQRYHCKTCNQTFTQPKPRTYEPHQRKVAQKGKKSMRGQPESYSEVKQKVSFSITPTVSKALSEFALSFDTNRSEVLERLVRNLITGTGNINELLKKL